MLGLFALLFELVDLYIQMLDLFLKFTLPPLIVRSWIESGYRAAATAD